MTTPYRQLTQGQRYQIEAGLIAGKNQVSLAKQLGVHPATISREIRRNSTENRYAAVSATQKTATQLFQRPRKAMRAVPKHTSTASPLPGSVTTCRSGFSTG